MIDDARLYDWDQFDAEKTLSVMGGFSGMWWVAGGWALDLWIGTPTRAHKDLDIAVLRHDHCALRVLLAEWDLWFAQPDSSVAPFQRLEPWDGTSLSPPLHAVWARRGPRDPWFCEFLLNEHHDDQWVFPGNPRVSRRVDAIGITINNLPVLAPEVVLLYKAREPEANASDFQAVLPRLSTEACLWLSHSVRIIDPTHPWLSLLEASGR